MKITRPLNQLLVKILIGINYASQLALESGKSIPVVYRQLDLLRHLGLLKKVRKGKKVVYEVDWVNISDIIANAIMLDVEKLSVLMSRKKNSNIVREITAIIENLPKDLIESPAAVQKLILKFLTNQRTITEDFFRIMNRQVDLDFDESIDMYLDVFGMMNQEERETFIRKHNIDDKETEEFLKYCRLRYLQKQLNDPKKEFHDELLK